MNKTQIPVYLIQNYEIEQPILPNPRINPKRYTSLEHTAQELTKAHNRSISKEENITVFDIIHWNLGLKMAHFKEFKKLVIKFDDEIKGRKI